MPRKWKAPEEGASPARSQPPLLALRCGCWPYLAGSPAIPSRVGEPIGMSMTPRPARRRRRRGRHGRRRRGRYGRAPATVGQTESRHDRRCPHDGGFYEGPSRSMPHTDAAGEDLAEHEQGEAQKICFRICLRCPLAVWVRAELWVARVNGTAIPRRPIGRRCWRAAPARGAPRTCGARSRRCVRSRCRGSGGGSFSRCSRSTSARDDPREAAALRTGGARPREPARRARRRRAHAPAAARVPVGGGARAAQPACSRASARRAA